MDFVLPQPKYTLSSLSTKELIKVEKANQSIAGVSMSESIFSNETITLHCKIISIKLLQTYLILNKFINTQSSN